jgi:hypothetical protein
MIVKYIRIIRRGFPASIGLESRSFTKLIRAFQIANPARGSRSADQALIEEIAPWVDDRNARYTKADWHFTTTDARVLKHLYPSIYRTLAISEINRYFEQVPV